MLLPAKDSWEMLQKSLPNFTDDFLAQRNQTLDTLIAAHGLALNAVVVTNNMREFTKVAGLRVEDWSVG